MKVPRYGIKIRKRVEMQEKTKIIKYKCPSCKKNTLRRIESGIWECKRCGFKVASKAYKFEQTNI
ncbi:MAG: 50S ribosomal protein L37ae [Candidatus Parvarchaeota archaeon]|nr:50S ribosomal protein L37ae [Candidatus Rehaiarchaeum fermentans]